MKVKDIIIEDDNSDKVSKMAYQSIMHKLKGKNGNTRRNASKLAHKLKKMWDAGDRLVTNYSKLLDDENFS